MLRLVERKNLERVGKTHGKGQVGRPTVHPKNLGQTLIKLKKFGGIAVRGIRIKIKSLMSQDEVDRLTVVFYRFSILPVSLQ